MFYSLPTNSYFCPVPNVIFKNVGTNWFDIVIFCNVVVRERKRERERGRDNLKI